MLKFFTGLFLGVAGGLVTKFFTGDIEMSLIVTAVLAGLIWFGAAILEMF
ncbi:hypothetical protein [Streptomyces virginiae]|nr:hypothetical protein [Streptomyces virginiae]